MQKTVCLIRNNFILKQNYIIRFAIIVLYVSFLNVHF